MGSQYSALTQEDMAFIAKQPLFYLASCSNAEVNLSPKGLDSLRIEETNTLLYLDYPGSGNRTATDIRNDGNVTLLFNAFDGEPLILRLFCKGELIEKTDDRFLTLAKQFSQPPSQIRRLIHFKIFAVERSCGMGVPVMSFQNERTGLPDWVSAQDKNSTLNAYMAAHETPPVLKNLS